MFEEQGKIVMFNLDELVEGSLFNLERAANLRQTQIVY